MSNNKHQFNYCQRVKITDELRKKLVEQKNMFDRYTAIDQQIQPNYQYAIVSKKFLEQWQKFVSMSRMPKITHCQTPSNLNVDIINTSQSKDYMLLYSHINQDSIAIFPKEINQIFSKYPGFTLFRSTFLNKRQIQLHPKTIKTFIINYDIVNKSQTVQTFRVILKKIFIYSHDSFQKVVQKILKVWKQPKQPQQKLSDFKIWIFEKDQKDLVQYGSQIKKASIEKNSILGYPGPQITQEYQLYDKVQNNNIVILQIKRHRWVYATSQKIKQIEDKTNLSKIVTQKTIMKSQMIAQDQQQNKIKPKKVSKVEMKIEQQQLCICGEESTHYFSCQCSMQFNQKFCSQFCLRNNCNHNSGCQYRSQEIKSKVEKISENMVGLVNLGNTCYMNSALQALIHTSIFNQYFVQNKYITEISKKNPLGYKGQMAKQYANLLVQYKNSSKQCYPAKFKQLFSKYKTDFKGYNQHDAQEFLLQLLDALHEDLNRAKDKPYLQQIYQYKDQMSDHINARQFWKMYTRLNQSIITDLFVTQLKFKLSCLYCNYKSIKFQNQKILSIPIPEQQTRVIMLYFIYHNYSQAPAQIFMHCPSNTIQQVYQNIQKIIKIPKTRVQLWMLGFKGRVKRIDEKYTISQIINLKHFNERSTQRQLFAIQCDQIQSISQNFVDLIFKFVNAKREAITFKRPFLITINQSLRGGHLYDVITRFLVKIISFKPKKQIHITKLQQQYLKLREKVDQGKIFSISMNYKIKKVENQNITYVYSTKLSNNTQIMEKIYQFPNEIEFEVAFDSQIQQSKFQNFHNCAIHQSKEKTKRQRDFGNFTLAQCIDQFSKRLTFSSNDGYECPKCKSTTTSENQMQIYKAPRNLILHLKRFKLQINGTYHKNQAKIKFPFQMNLKSTLGNQTLPEAYFYDKGQNVFIKPSYWNYAQQPSTTGNCVYELYATINHSGTMNGGHYVSYAKQGGKWALFNDQRVRIVEQQQVLNCQAYILFYQRKMN